MSVASRLAEKVIKHRVTNVLAKQIIALKKKTPLKYVKLSEIEADVKVFAKARYLYWACFRGHVNLIKHILENDKISPFARIYDGRSPMMATLIGKQAPNTKNGSLTEIESNFCTVISNKG